MEGAVGGYHASDGRGGAAAGRSPGSLLPLEVVSCADSGASAPEHSVLR